MGTTLRVGMAMASISDSVIGINFELLPASIFPDRSPDPRAGLPIKAMPLVAFLESMDMAGLYLTREADAGRDLELGSASFPILTSPRP